MAYTLAQLRIQVLGLLGDPINALFTAAQIDDWINRAIEDLSTHFPTYVDYAIITVAGQHIYDLETYIKGIVSVEYPTGETPPRYLKRKTYTSSIFWISGEGYYDFVKTQTSDSTLPPQLYVSDHTPVAKTITVKCESDHTVLTAPADTCTVLERHIHLIGLFVQWKAFAERASHDMEDPNPLSTRYSSMSAATERVMNAYLRALDRATSAEAESAIVSWKMDGVDQIY